MTAAGCVEDEELQNVWAQLLAGAVINADARHPSFVEALRLLMPSDVRLMDFISVSGVAVGAAMHDERRFTLGPQVFLIRPTDKVHFDTTALNLDNLSRLGLVEQSNSYPGDEIGISNTLKYAKEAETGASLLNVRMVSTTFGEAFHRACSPPRPD